MRDATVSDFFCFVLVLFCFFMLGGGSGGG